MKAVNHLVSSYNLPVPPEKLVDSHFSYLVSREYYFHRDEEVAALRGVTLTAKQRESLRKASLMSAVRFANSVVPLEKSSAVDHLTGAFNRGALDKFVFNLLSKRRPGLGDAICIMDIDNFKKFNEKYGHIVGDEVLRQLKKMMTDLIRGYDLFGRYGGEEFALIMPEIDVKDPNYYKNIMERLEAMREAIAGGLSNRLVNSLQKLGYDERMLTNLSSEAITMSMGLWIADENVRLNNPEDLGPLVWDRADRYLAAAKHQHGKNVVVGEKGPFGKTKKNSLTTPPSSLKKLLDKLRRRV